MKKILSAALAAVLLAGAVSLAAFAETPTAELAQLPAEGSVCTACGEGEMHALTASTPWETQELLPCALSPFWSDAALEREVTHYRYCDGCGALFSFTETETRASVHLHDPYYMNKYLNNTL